MARVKRGTKRRARRKKYLKRTKGFFLTKSSCTSRRRRRSNRADRFAYRDRRVRKRQFRTVVDPAHRRGRPRERAVLQPVDAWAQGGRRGDRPQDAGRSRREGCGGFTQLAEQAKAASLTAPAKA